MDHQHPPSSHPNSALARLQRIQLTCFNENSNELTRPSDQDPDAEHIHKQEGTNTKEKLKACLPTDPKTFSFVLVIVTCLIVGVIHFCHTEDTGILTGLLPYVGGYVGLTEAKTALISWKEKRESDQQSPTGK